jgi:hypothetical protein
LEEASAIIWRVKKWKISPSSSASISSTTRAGYNIEVSCSNLPSASVTSEDATLSFSNILEDESKIITNNYGPIPSYQGVNALWDTAWNNLPSVSFQKGVRNYATASCTSDYFSEEGCSAELSATAEVSSSFKIYPIAIKEKDTENYYIPFLFSANASAGDSAFFDGQTQHTSSLQLAKPAGFYSPIVKEWQEEGYYKKEASWLEYPSCGEYSFDGGYWGYLLGPVCGISGYLSFTVPVTNRIMQIPLYGYSIVSIGFYGTTYCEIAYQDTTTASVQGGSVEPLEYWEYDDGNENPIYDKDTGEILRDPVTGAPV